MLSSCGGGERGCFVRGWWPIPISALAVRRGRSDRGCRGSFQPGTGGCALSVRSWSARQASPCGGASMSRTMLNGSLVRSGRLRLEFAHHVVGAPSDLARNGEDGSFAADARGSLCMQSAVGAVGTLRMLGCFDQSPTWEGPASQGRGSTGSGAVVGSGASVVALPYMGARGGGAGGRIGAAAAHSRPGQRCRAGRFVGARRKLFRRWGRCSHGIGQAACSSSARTWWARRAILRATVRAARLLPLRSLPAR